MLARPVVVRRVLVVGLTAMLVGVLSGVFWALATPLPGYVVQPEGAAVISERGLTEFIIGDIVFAGTGLVVGAGLSIVGWLWYGRSLGWWTVPVTCGLVLVAGIVCWQVGQWVGPQDFGTRLADAAVGELVPIDLRLRALGALAAWVVAACLTLMVITAVVRDPDEGRPLRLPWTARTEA